MQPNQYSPTVLCQPRQPIPLCHSMLLNFANLSFHLFICYYRTKLFSVVLCILSLLSCWEISCKAWLILTLVFEILKVISQFLFPPVELLHLNQKTDQLKGLTHPDLGFWGIKRYKPVSISTYWAVTFRSKERSTARLDSLWSWHLKY